MKVLNFQKCFHFVNIIICINVSVVNSVWLPNDRLQNNSKLLFDKNPHKNLSKTQEERNLPQFALDYSELFNNLTHSQQFFPNCSNLTERMENLYSSSKFLTLDFDGFHNVLKKAFTIWSNSDAATYMKFEDLFAILYYTGNGYKEMENDFDESRRMKNAIYRLAITQSLHSKEYEGKLYRGEAMPSNWYENKFNKLTNLLVFQNFSSTSTDRFVAELYSGIRNINLTRTETIYQLSFTESFLRADVENYSLYQEKERILLPGTMFFVNTLNWRIKDGKKVGLTIELTHHYGNMTLFDHQRQVMRELQNLQNSGTQFYVC